MRHSPGMDLDKSPELRQALLEVGRCARSLRSFLALATIAIVVWLASTIWYMGFAFRTQDGVMKWLREAGERLSDSTDARSKAVDLETGMGDPKNANAAEQYLKVYFLIQKADAALGAGDRDGARAQYEEALGCLKTVEAKHPEWRQDLVKYRKRYLTDKIKSVTDDENPPAK